MRAVGAVILIGAITLLGCVTNTGLSQADRDYIDYVDRSVSVTGESVARFSELLSTPRLGNATWEQSVRDELYLWKAAYDDAIAHAAPDSMRELKTKHIEAFGLLDEAATFTLDGLSARRASSIDLATDRLNAANKAIIELRFMISDYERMP